jgi:hypothetical protein
MSQHPKLKLSHMKIRINKTESVIIILILLLINGSSAGQTGYLAGTGQSGIEPDESLISLHLSGYGAPRDGRFTLQWIYRGEAPESVSMTGLDDRLYVKSGTEILWCVPSGPVHSWESAGDAGNKIYLGGYDGKLYALGKNGEISASDPEMNIKWKKICEADPSARMFTIDSGTIYVTDGKGILWQSSFQGKDFIWSKAEMPADIISFSSDNGKLYALAGDGILYRCDTKGSDRRWLRAAYKNNETIKEDIKLIGFLNERIYGIDRDNSLYIGEHRSEGNLTARALAIKKEGKTVVLLNVDLLGLFADFSGLIKHEIFLRHGLPPEALFMNFSHTHFAPVTQEWPTWQEANQRPDSIYLWSDVRKGILDAVDQALGSLEPADIYFGRGTTDIGYNRSLKDHQELYDSDVDVLKIVYRGKKPENYLFMAACHPVFSTAGTLHYTISANYPGVARKLVEERTGTINSLFLQGTAGDINPRDNGEYISGEKLANDVLAVLDKPMQKIVGPISLFLDTIDIAIEPWSKAEIMQLRKENEGKTGDVYAEKNVKWADLMMDYYDKGTMPHSLPVYIHTVNIGNWKLVGFSRETTTGYSLGVKKLWPDKFVSVAGYTNDVSSYLPTHMHLEAGNYEGLDSFFWYGSANVFPHDADEIILGRISELAH